MKYSKILIIVILVAACAQKVEPTVENVNKIFISKDFTFEFVPYNGIKKSLSFRSDYLVYKSERPTFRRDISYDEVLLINDYIQKIVDRHTTKLDPETASYYVIKNTAYKVVIVPDQEDYYFDALLKTLKLDTLNSK